MVFQIFLGVVLKIIGEGGFKENVSILKAKCNRTNILGPNLGPGWHCHVHNCAIFTIFGKLLVIDFRKYLTFMVLNLLKISLQKGRVQKPESLKISAKGAPPKLVCNAPLGP